jgi:hypothetical protein
VRSDLDLPVTEILDQHNIPEVSDTIVNLDLVLKELLEGGDVEDLVACRLRSVDDELFFSSAQAVPRTASTQILLCRSVRGEDMRLFTLLVTLACLPLADFCKSMILAYCITPQPLKRQANSKAISCTYC